MHTFGFIALGDGVKRLKQNGRLYLRRPGLVSDAVESVEEAVQAARRMLAMGVQQIQLYGPFDAPAAARIQAATGHRIPIGYARY